MTPWRAIYDTLEGKRRHPGGQEMTPWRARDNTLEGKRRHHGGQETTPWRAREDTMEAREDTLEGKRRWGRQRKTWLDNIQEWTHRDLLTALHTAEDIQHWGGLCVNGTPTIVPVKGLRKDKEEGIDNWFPAFGAAQEKARSLILAQEVACLKVMYGHFHWLTDTQGEVSYN